MRETTIHEILDKRIISIVRGVEPDKMVRIAEALYEGGVTMIEVTFNQKNLDSWQETEPSLPLRPPFCRMLLSRFLMKSRNLNSLRKKTDYGSGDAAQPIGFVS